MDQTFLIAEIPGFTPQIGRLVSMMHYVRSTTLAAVAGLGIEELDYLHDQQSNSIGALLCISLRLKSAIKQPLSTFGN